MKTLKYGSRGSLVQLLQLALSRAGKPLDLDGSFGSATKAALLAFQREESLPATGETSAALWRALEPYTAGYTIHRFKRGESLTGIAQMHGSALPDIETANPCLDPLNIRPGAGIVVPLPFEPVPGNIAWSAYLAAQCMRGLTARYPFLSAGTFGHSAMGKPLRYLSAGAGGRVGIFTAAHHANEWITAPALLRFVRELAEAYVSGGEVGGVPAAEIFARTKLYFAPLVNPDGVDLVTGALESGYYSTRAEEIAADYPFVPFPDGWKANIRGTDLNLQYPAGWEAAQEIKYAQGWISPAPRDYVGTAPLAASESRALYSLTRQVVPSIALAFHTQGEVIYWQYHGYAPPGAQELAEKLASVSGYALDSVPDESSNAGYKDWCIDSLGIPAFTIECGLGENPLPLEQFAGISAAASAICAEAAAWCATA